MSLFFSRGWQERLFLFRDLICKDVDWTGLGMPAYSCFDAFFKRIWSEAVTAPPPSAPAAAAAAPARLEAETTNPPARAAGAAAGAGSATEVEAAGEVAGRRKGETTAAGAGAGTSVPLSGPSAAAGEEDLTELGVDTLWRVTLTSLNKEVADSATHDLLEVSGGAGQSCLFCFSLGLFPLSLSLSRVYLTRRDKQVDVKAMEGGLLELRLRCASCWCWCFFSEMFSTGQDKTRGSESIVARKLSLGRDTRKVDGGQLVKTSEHVCSSQTSRAPF